LIAQARENVKALKMAAVQNAFKDIRPAIELDFRLAEIALSSLEAAAPQPVAVPTVSFYRDGIVAAAAWVDAQREAYDSEHGRHDPDTGAFEFSNNAQLEHSTTLADIADGIRALHPNTAQPVAVPDDVIPGGLAYSSALPKFESNDSDKVIGYSCFISGNTRIVESQEQAYADAKAVVSACLAAMPAAPVNPEFTTHLVGEVVAWHHPNHERNVDFRWLDFNVEPGTKLYAIKQERN